jgi:hypothetical protein
VAEKIVAQLRNSPRQKIDLIYDAGGIIRAWEKVNQPAFILRMWQVHPAEQREIVLTPAEFIQLLKAGLDYYEINGEAVRKLGLQVVK